MANHLLRSQTNRLGDMIRHVEVRRPDCPDHLCHRRRAGVSLNRMPEQRRDSSSDNCEACKVKSEGSTSGDGVRNVETGADEAVEDKWNGAHQTAADDAVNRLTPGYRQLPPTTTIPQQRNYLPS